MQEEVENNSVQLAVRSTKVTLKLLLRALRAYVRHRQNKKQLKQYAKSKDSTVKGKQTVKELVGQGVSSMEIDDSGIKDFKKLANKYGVDFAIVKDNSESPAKYTVFFKARDADAITQVLKEYAARQTKRKKSAEKERPSILQKLKKFKEKVSSMPRKLNREVFGELPGPRGIIVSSLCGSTNQRFAVIYKGDFPFPFQTSDQNNELEVKSRMQAIDFYCKKCRKSMRISYALTGDRTAPAMNGIMIKCHTHKCTRVVTLKNFTEGQIAERTDALGKCYL